MWIALESHGKILTAIAADKPVYVKLCEPLPPDQNDTQLWCFDRGFLINKQTAYVLGIKNDRLKDGESVVQATRRPAQEGMSQRWEMNDNKIYLRKKNELVLTSNIENNSVHVCKPVEGGDASQVWEQVPRTK